MYDTIKELHIEIEQRVQQVTSNRYGAMSHEFYDMVLNRTAVQYVQIKSNRKTNYKAEGLEDSKKRVDDIASLKRETTWIPTMKCADEPNRALVLLPGDYLKLITSTSRLKYAKKVYNPDIHKVFTGENIKPLYYHILDLKSIFDQLLDKGIDSADQIFLTLNYTGTRISDITRAAANISDIYKFVKSNGKNNYDIFEISHLMCDKLREEFSNEYGVYWERFMGRNYPNCIIITSRTRESHVIEVDGVNVITSVEGRDVFVDSYEEFDISSIKNDYRYSPNDLIATENLRSTLNNFYGNKNRHLNPITEIIDDKLYVYYGDDFCIDAIKISYIKIPKAFSYHLDQMSDLTITPEFMDLVVSNILIILKDDSANTVRQQFNLE